MFKNSVKVRTSERTNWDMLKNIKIKNNSACAKKKIHSIITKINIFPCHVTNPQSMKTQSQSLSKI